MKNLEPVHVDDLPSLWTREGLTYVARSRWYKPAVEGRLVHVLTVTRKLDFVSCHLVRYIHGIKGLNEMAIAANKNTNGFVRETVERVNG